MSPASTSLERGPVTANRPKESVTLVTVTSSDGLMWSLSQSRSWVVPMTAELR